MHHIVPRLKICNLCEGLEILKALPESAGESLEGLRERDEENFFKLAQAPPIVRGKVTDGNDRIEMEAETDGGAVAEGINVHGGTSFRVLAGPRHKSSPLITEPLEEGLQTAPLDRLPDVKPFEPIHECIQKELYHL
jgi:hypothetical protein